MSVIDSVCVCATLTQEMSPSVDSDFDGSMSDGISRGFDARL